MKQTRKRVSPLKVVLLWALMIGNLLFWIWLWGFRGRPEAAPAQEAGSAGMIGFSIVLVFLSLFFLGLGGLAYFILLMTNCFTLNFTRPFLPAYKLKLYLAKIVVPLLISLGLGGLLSVAVTPVLRGLGLDSHLAWFLPMTGTVVIVQIVLIWVGIWTPIGKRLITNRLVARGISREQLREATFIGISDPTRSSFKKMTIVEDDMGALWITPQQLIYWGDSQDFSIRPDQLIQLERRGDAGSVSMLGGLAHIVLHISPAGGETRQVRLHIESEWTLMGARRKMEQLSQEIAVWHTAAMPTVPT
jgi:hypothetical protein